MDDLKIEMPKSRVYILIGKDNKLECIEGEYSLPSDLTDWVLYDEGYGDRYNLAQSRYLDKPLIDFDGTHNYKYDREELLIVECTEEEKAEERASFPPAPQTTEDALLELYEIEADQEERICLLEMGMSYDDFME